MGNTNCPVCNTPIKLQTDFCPECGFQRHIFPDGVSEAVQTQENERVAMAKAAYKKADNAKKEMQSKLDEANQNLQTKQSELKAANEQLQAKQSELKAAANQQLQAKQLELDAANRQLQAKQLELDAANQQLLANDAANQQLQAKQLELDAANRQLLAKHNEWQKVKEANLKLETALEQTKKKLDDAIKNTPTQTDPTLIKPTSPNPGEANRGNLKAILEIQGRSYNLYKGENVFMSPQHIDVGYSCILFKVIEENGLFYFYNEYETAKKANGGFLGRSKTLLRHGNIIAINDISIRFVQNTKNWKDMI